MNVAYHSYLLVGISILYAKPHKEPPDLFSFMAPLSLKVWLYMATAYLCISVLLFFLAKYDTILRLSATFCNFHSQNFDSKYTELPQMIGKIPTPVILIPLN